MNKDEWKAKKIKDIKEHPEKHIHDFPKLQMCCWWEGTFDLEIMEMHKEIE